jgi:hypothetical protein
MDLANNIEEYQEDENIELCSCEMEEKEGENIKWVDCGSCWLLDAPQKSKTWLKIRAKLLTASNVGFAIGKAQDYNTRESIAERIRKQLEGGVDNEHTRRGIELEPHACRFYRSTRKCRVKHTGLVIPKQYTRIGGSVDGIPIFSDDKLNNGLVEYKAPNGMYASIINYVRSSNKPKNYKHIQKIHRCQMMTNMRILGKEWCDYVAFAPDFKGVEEEPIEGFIQRYPYDEIKWTKIYHKINEFFDEFLPGYKSNIIFNN